MVSGRFTQCDYTDEHGRCPILAAYAITFGPAEDNPFHSRFPAFPAVSCRQHTLHALLNSQVNNTVTIPPYIALSGI
jgi:hypothetical protein